MKIGNSRLYFSNPNHLRQENCNYYAAYDYCSDGVIYLGTFTKEALIEHIHNSLQTRHRHIYAYARKTMDTRGKTGRYEVTVNSNYYNKVVRHKNKYAARRSISYNIVCGHKCRIIDLETGEVIGHWNDTED